jgi:hypothetical protein
MVSAFLPQPPDGLILGISPRFEGHLPIYSAIQAHPSRLFVLAVGSLGLRRSGSSSQIIDQAQDVNEQASRDRDLGKLERDVSTMVDDLGADLDELLSQCGQRPMFDRFGQGECPHEVAEIVGQGVKPKTDGIVAEPPA